MPSPEYEALRANVKPGLALPGDDVMVVREKMLAIHPTQVPADARVEHVELGGVPCAWVDVPESAGSDRVVLWVHGGAFVSTGLEHYVPYCAGLARHRHQPGQRGGGPHHTRPRRSDETPRS